MAVVKIDGSYGEGGGQILRTSIALSCVTMQPVEIVNIRANRPKPGLSAQHLKGIEAAKIITDAEVEGLKLRSTRVLFKPRKLKPGNFKIDIGTAGSISLILQTILLPLMYSGGYSSVEIIGGTDVSWSPPIDYIRFVTFEALKKLNGNAEIELISRGYYPKGGGRIKLHVNTSKLIGTKFERIECEVIRGISHCSNLPSHVAKRQAEAAKAIIEKNGYKSEIQTEVRREISTGSGITLWCGYKGGNSLGEKGKKAEIVGEEAAKMLIERLKSQASFDEHLADQIMIFAAVAKGKTEYTTTEVTLHQKSNAYVINSFLGECVKIDGGTKTILIDGRNL